MTPTPHQPDLDIEALRKAAELRMDAYYYGFDKTGVPEIDRVLSAVACAGKAYHHTNSWGDEATAYQGHVGETPVDWIQNAANDAAAAWNRRAQAAVGAVPEGAITGDEVTALAHKLIRELTTELGDCEDDEALNYCARGIGSLNADILTFIKNRATPPAAAPSEPVAMMTCGKCGKDRLTEGCQRLDCEFVGTALTTPPAQDAGTGEKGAQ